METRSDTVAKNVQKQSLSIILNHYKVLGFKVSRMIMKLNFL